jgi:hypothetical protein
MQGGARSNRQRGSRFGIEWWPKASMSLPQSNVLDKGNFGERSGRREERLWHKASQGSVRQVRVVVYLAGFVRVKRILKLPCRKSTLIFFLPV